MGQSQLDLITPYTVDIEATSPKPYVIRITGTYFPVWEPYKTQMDSVRVLFSSVMLSLVRVLFDGRSLKQIVLDTAFPNSVSKRKEWKKMLENDPENLNLNRHE